MRLYVSFWLLGTDSTIAQLHTPFFTPIIMLIFYTEIPSSTRFLLCACVFQVWRHCARRFCAISSGMHLTALVPIISLTRARASMAGKYVCMLVC